MQKNPSLRSFCAGVLSKNLDAFILEMEGVRAAKDPEYIHRMRVASRRLRNALTLFSPLLSQKKMERWYRQVRDVARTLGYSRDLDVQIQFLNEYCQTVPEPRRNLPGIKRLLLRIMQSRARMQDKVNQSLDLFLQSGIMPEIRALAEAWQPDPQAQTNIPIELYILARDSICSRMEDMLSFEELIMDPHRVLELHAMRKAAKWLRYTLETYQIIYQEECKTYLQILKKTQDMLGFIHDCDVWTEYLPQFIEKEKGRVRKFYGSISPFSLLEPGLIHFFENRKMERQTAYQDFIAQWLDWKNEERWNKLRKLVEVPF